MHADRLGALARKYIWWKSPQEALIDPDRVIAQVMNIGDFDDMQKLASQVGDDVLRHVLTHAQAGQFNARSWTYWHYRLGLCEVDEVPPLPVRGFGCSRDVDDQPVKTRCAETAGFARIGEPDFTQDGVMQVASLDDLMATKVKVVLQRAEAKDYRDIAAMIRNGVDLARGLASARLLFGPNFQPSESLKALVYFDDGDLATLTPEDRKTLIDGVKAAVALPNVALASTRLAGV